MANLAFFLALKKKNLAFFLFNVISFGVTSRAIQVTAIFILPGAHRRSEPSTASGKKLVVEGGCALLPVVHGDSNDRITENR